MCLGWTCPFLQGSTQTSSFCLHVAHPFSKWLLSRMFQCTVGNPFRLPYVTHWLDFLLFPFRDYWSNIWVIWLDHCTNRSSCNIAHVTVNKEGHCLCQEARTGSKKNLVCLQMSGDKSRWYILNSKLSHCVIKGSLTNPSPSEWLLATISV